MLKGPVIHPQILLALAECGHGSRVLIAGANYPVTAMASHRAHIVYLNLMPGLVSGVDAVRALASLVAVESALYMTPTPGTVPEPVQAYQAILGRDVPFSACDRFDFYKYAREDSLCLAVATGEQRTYSSLLATIGVVAEKQTGTHT